MKKVDFIFFDAGGGHRSAATALISVIGQQGRPWRTRMLNLQELLDPLDVFRKLTGLRVQDIYNTLLRKGWTLGSAQLLKGLLAVIKLYHRKQVRLLESIWKQDPPDLMVSVVPHFNRSLLESLRNASPSSRFVTVLTDLADYPPHFWIERQEQYIICGTEKAVEQARAMGHSEERIFRTSGMILRPSFYDRPAVDRAAERRRLGLDPKLPTGLVLFGGYGSGQVEKIARLLQGSRTPLQLILICGRNQQLTDSLRQMKTRMPVHIEGFTDRIPYFMALSDFFIGKPGPGSISEALAMGLPVIVERNAWTLPQERYNADWVLENQVGVVLKSFDAIVEAVEQMLAAGRLEKFRANAARLENRAVFEIPDILQEILDRS